MISPSTRVHDCGSTGKQYAAPALQVCRAEAICGSNPKRPRNGPDRSSEGVQALSSTGEWTCWDRANSSPLSPSRAQSWGDYRRQASRKAHWTETSGITSCASNRSGASASSTGSIASSASAPTGRGRSVTGPSSKAPTAPRATTTAQHGGPGHLRLQWFRPTAPRATTRLPTHDAGVGRTFAAGAGKATVGSLPIAAEHAH